MSRENFIASAVQLASDFDKNSNVAFLSAYRQEQRDLLSKAVFPHSKVEHFKYNRLDAFDNFAFDKLALATELNQATELDLRAIQGLAEGADVDRIVFVDGQFAESLSSINHHAIVQFADADAQQQEKIVAMLSGQDVSFNPFNTLNASLSQNGIFIAIDENSPENVIEVVEVISPAVNNSITATQVLIDIADNAEATMVNRTISLDLTQQSTGLSTSRFVSNVGNDATFTHYNLQLENAPSIHFGYSEYNLHSKTTLDGFHVATGSAMKKMDIVVNHLGQHAHAGLDGLYIATDEQQIDYHTIINHPLPNGTTDENFRGIINGSAEGVFNGRILIEEDAQKTLAELSNKNILMSDNASVHTKPELEIYADDVICAHGATVSRLEDAAKYYLQARGIDTNEAEIMLSVGFINELLIELADEAVAEYLRPILFARFDNTATANA